MAEFIREVHFIVLYNMTFKSNDIKHFKKNIVISFSILNLKEIKKKPKKKQIFADICMNL